LSRQPKQIAIDGRHPIETPVLRVTRNQPVYLLDILDRARHELARKIGHGRRFFGVVLKKYCGNLVDRVMRDIPLEQHLERIFSCFSSWSHFSSA
jgi:hypothetical protein